MHFTDADQRAAYQHVAGLLMQLYGESARAETRAPLFWLTNGSAEIGVSVESLGDKRIYVRVFSWVITGAPLDTELLQYLVEANLTFRLGAFGVDEVGDIEFVYGLSDYQLTAAGLRTALGAVMQSADLFGNAIKERFGGSRAVDRMREAQTPVDFERALEEAGLAVPPADEPGRS